MSYYNHGRCAACKKNVFQFCQYWGEPIHISKNAAHPGYHFHPLEYLWSYTIKPYHDDELLESTKQYIGDSMIWKTMDLYYGYNGTLTYKQRKRLIAEVIYGCGEFD